MSDLVTIQRDRYYDSVLLLRLSLDLEETDGIDDAIVAMATEHNRGLLADNGYRHPDLADAGPNDLVIAVRGKNLDLDETKLQALVADLFAVTIPASGETVEQPRTLDAALARLPEAQLVLLSIPGEHAAREARRALDRGRNVMIFSDNVSIDDELALKERAKERGLFVLGPDCGTAIIGGKPLAFANVVRRGNIGVVGASGTGIQEVTSCIDRLGGGVTQAIGTGGRDLSEAIGGTTFLRAIELFAQDDETAVIVAISKPPAEAVAQKVIDALHATQLPAVVHFVGDRRRDVDDNVFFADSLAAAAEIACELGGVDTDTPPPIDEDLVAELEAKLPNEATLGGLFCGGTTGYEALNLLEASNITVRSNLHKDKARKIDGLKPVSGHVVLDLGDDVFTRGRPHPMIEPELRSERLLAELEAQPKRALLLFDCVLGYGSHEDPAGILAASLVDAKKRWPDHPLVAIASITGTEADPQGFSRARERLRAEGIVVMTDNRRAAELCAAILAKHGQRSAR